MEDVQYQRCPVIGCVLAKDQHSTPWAHRDSRRLFFGQCSKRADGWSDAPRCLKPLGHPMAHEFPPDYVPYVEPQPELTHEGREKPLLAHLRKMKGKP